MTHPYHVVAEGFSHIDLKYSPETYAVSREEKEFLDDFVAIQAAKAKEKGGLFFDGDMTGILLRGENAPTVRGNVDTLALNMQAMKYSQHAGLFRARHDAPIQAAYLCGLAITRDNYLVFGKNQATEVNFMGKLGIPAGGIIEGFGGAPSFDQLYRELSEEIGFAEEYHLDGKVILGWMNGMSAREGNYHLTTSFIVPLRLSKDELHDYFKDWKDTQQRLLARIEKSGGKKKKVEFADLHFLPNDADYLRNFIDEQDSKGKDANLLGKSLDVVEEWVSRYSCDPFKVELIAKNEGAIVYLPQPLIPVS